MACSKIAPLERNVRVFSSTIKRINETIRIENYERLVKTSENGKHSTKQPMDLGSDDSENFHFFPFCDGRSAFDKGQLGLLFVTKEKQMEPVVHVVLTIRFRARNGNVLCPFKDRLHQFRKNHGLYVEKCLANNVALQEGDAGYIGSDGSLTFEVDMQIYSPVVPVVAAQARGIKRKYVSNDQFIEQIQHKWQNQPNLRDATLIASCGKRIGGHKLVFAARSSLLAVHLANPVCHQEIIVAGPGSSLQLAVDYMYKNVLEPGLPIDTVMEVMDMARSLKMLDLMCICEERVIELLSKDNVLQVVPMLFELITRSTFECSPAKVVVPDLQRHVRAVMRGNPEVGVTDAYGVFNREHRQHLRTYNS